MNNPVIVHKLKHNIDQPFYKPNPRAAPEGAGNVQRLMRNDWSKPCERDREAYITRPRQHPKSRTRRVTGGRTNRSDVLGTVPLPPLSSRRSNSCAALDRRQPSGARSASVTARSDQEPKLAQTTLLKALAEMLDCKTKPQSKPQHGHHELLRQESSIEDSHNPPPKPGEERAADVAQKLWGGPSKAAPHASRLGDHSGDNIAEITMSLRGHLHECGVKMARSEEEELRKMCPQEAILSGMITHTQFVALLKILRSRSTAAQSLYQAQPGVSARSSSGDMAYGHSDAAARTHRMSEILFSNEHPHIPSKEVRRNRLELYRNKLNNMTQVRNEQEEISVKKQQKIHNTEQACLVKKRSQQDVYKAQVEARAAVNDYEAQVEIRNLTIAHQESRFNEMVDSEKHKVEVREAAHMNGFVQCKARYDQAVADMSSFQDKKKERLQNGLRMQRNRYERGVRENADEYLLHPSEPKQNKNFMHDVVCPNGMPLPNCLKADKPSSPTARKAARAFNEIDHDGDGVLSALELQRAGRLGLMDGHVANEFGAIDRNGDGFIDKDEYEKAYRDQLAPVCSSRTRGSVKTSRSMMSDSQTPTARITEIRRIPPPPATGRGMLYHNDKVLSPQSTGRAASKNVIPPATRSYLNELLGAEFT